MVNRAAHGTACLAVLFSLLLAGCVARGPVLGKRTELAATPFFPQARYQCGPAAMATVLAASGVAITPEALSSSLYLPARRGSLQLEMRATPRDFARLAVPLSRNPESIVAELAAGRPVAVLHNYGLRIWPRWHYAVVVGYDPDEDVFILRSGTRQREEMRTRRFMVAWHYAGRWSLVILRPGETPALDDARTFLEAAAEFERTASPVDARAVFDGAIRRWPAEPLGFVGRGTAEYRLGNLSAAARDYAQALRLDGTQAGARNNLAQTLLDLRCPHRAAALLADLDTSGLQPVLREAVANTQSHVRAAAAIGPDEPACPGIL
jgi:tetratricopeptide (TPR) repeat protein